MIPTVLITLTPFRGVCLYIIYLVAFPVNRENTQLSEIRGKDNRLQVFQHMTVKGGTMYHKLWRHGSGRLTKSNAATSHCQRRN